MQNNQNVLKFNRKLMIVSVNTQIHYKLRTQYLKVLQNTISTKTCDFD